MTLGDDMAENSQFGIYDDNELARTISLMRIIGKDTQHYEVKKSRKEMPTDLPTTLSAFSNGAGGAIICGISEQDGFVPAKGFDPGSIQDSIANTCIQKLTPPVRPDIRILTFEDAPVVVANIPEMRPADKPCYISNAGKYGGSYIRTGDGDRRLSQYEVDRLIEEHRQPNYDAGIVRDANMEDLDEALLQGLLARERHVHPRIFASLPDIEACINLNVASFDDAGVVRPTLAGLLALGKYPQRFFPRLNVSFACYAGTRKSDTTPSGQRLLDSSTMVGPIPMIVEDAIAAIVRNTRTGALIDGAFRKDIPDYPLVALREALVNALMHRDYSDMAHGTPVQVDLYVDRLEIINPGGLYGNVTLDMLGKEGVSSSRNQRLSNILESTPYQDGYIAENRGTGYQTIEAELSEALMPPPVPRDSIGSFSITFEKRSLSRTERSLTTKETIEATVLSMLKERSSISTREVMSATNKSKATVVSHINLMTDAGLLEPTEPSGSTKQRYRLAKRRNPGL